MNQLEEAVQDALTTAPEPPDLSVLRARVRRHRHRRVLFTFGATMLVALLGAGLVAVATRDSSTPPVQSPPGSVDVGRSPVTSDRSFTNDDGKVVRGTQFVIDARVPMPHAGKYHWESPVLKAAELTDPTKQPDFSISYGFQGGTAIFARGRLKQSIAYRDGGWVVSVDRTVVSIVGKPTMLIAGILLNQSQLTP
jgi:hypothetical protein